MSGRIVEVEAPVIVADRAPTREDRPHWEDRYDELHKAGVPMPGPWVWEIHDHSMATLCGGGEDAITGFIMAISPCKACADRAEPREWAWARCTTPSEPNARLIAAAPDLLKALQATAGIEPLIYELGDCLDTERRALERELKAIHKQVHDAIAKAIGSPNAPASEAALEAASKPLSDALDEHKTPANLAEGAV